MTTRKRSREQAAASIELMHWLQICSCWNDAPRRLGPNDEIIVTSKSTCSPRKRKKWSKIQLLREIDILPQDVMEYVVAPYLDDYCFNVYEENVKDTLIEDLQTEFNYLYEA